MGRQDRRDLVYGGESETLSGLVEDWRPKIHCSNCLECKVRKNSEGEVIAFCAQGYGEPKLLVQIIKPMHAQGWRNAKTCPNYSDMDDEC